MKMNTHVARYFPTWVFYYSDHKIRTPLIAEAKRLTFSRLHITTVFQNICINLHVSQQCLSAIFLHHMGHFHLKIVANLIDKNCTPFITNQNEKIFVVL